MNREGWIRIYSFPMSLGKKASPSGPALGGVPTSAWAIGAIDCDMPFFRSLARSEYDKVFELHRVR